VSFTRDLLDGLALLLAAGDTPIATYDPDGASYAPTETGVVFGDLPQAPDRVVALTAYGVSDDAGLTDTVQGVQVRTRAGTDPGDVDDLADAVFDLLHGASDLTVGGFPVVLIRRVSFVPLGVDGNRRHERSDNYYVTVRRPSPHRID
jgi:Bacteriophage minor capsid protein